MCAPVFPATIPTNPTTGREYSGSNLEPLVALCLEHQLCGEFATFRQWRAAGRIVKKGSKGVKVVRVSERIEETEDKKTGEKVKEKRTWGKAYYVFPVEWTEPIEDAPAPEDGASIHLAPIVTEDAIPPKAPRYNVGKWRAMADKLEEDGEARASRESGHTGRQKAMAQSTRIDGAVMLRASKIIKGLCDAIESGETLKAEINPKLVKADFLRAAKRRCECDSSIHHNYRNETEEWSDESPLATVLREYGGLSFSDPVATRQQALDRLTAKHIPGFFPTPNALAEKMATIADFNGHNTVLDPSCGIGSLLKAACAHVEPKSVQGFEINQELAAFAQCDTDAMIQCCDFMEQHAELCNKYSVILMNPPYEKNQAPQHVLHALRFLAPGGRLVALLPANLRAYHERGQDGNRHVNEFCKALNKLACKWHDVPSGSFSGKDAAVKAGVEVAILEIQF